MSRTGRSARIGVALLGLIPLAQLIFAFATDGLGADPVEDITHTTGIWALRLLWITLALTPLRRSLKLGWLVVHRRTLGLLAFLYGLLHFATYLFLELELRFQDLAEDLAERPFIALGFSAFVLLTPLAITSTQKWMRRLGGGWKRLHGLVYLAAPLAALHFVLSAKADLREPSIYAILLAGLLATRLLGPGSLSAGRPSNDRRP